VSRVRVPEKSTLLSTIAICFALQSAAAAEPPATTRSDSSDELQEVVITGTLIRGVAPPGTNVIAVTNKDVQATGSSTTAQVLQTIPQLGSFNNLQYPQGGFSVQTTNRPNLRNLPGFTTSGSSATLLLLDGHRIVGMGVSTTSPDPDIVPPALIERVEIVPDGGSAIYGSDAVAGVINFITRKSFSGIEVDAKNGVGESPYKTFDTNVTAGRDLGRGSVFISYNYSRHDSIYGRDRDFVKTVPSNVSGIPFPVTSLRCSLGNVQLVPSGTVYALPYTTATAVANTTNQCSESDAVTIYPREHRNSVLAGL